MLGEALNVRQVSPHACVQREAPTEREIQNERDLQLVCSTSGIYSRSILRAEFTATGTNGE